MARIRIHMVLSVVVFVLLSTLAIAQDKTLDLTGADAAAAQHPSSLVLNSLRALTDVGEDSSRSQLIEGQNPSERHGDGSGPVLFPADLSKSTTNPGAPTLATTTLHNIFVNQPPSAWGDPIGFLNDLNSSRFVHITDQYVGARFNNRYPQGTSFGINVPPDVAFPPDPNAPPNTPPNPQNVISIGLALQIVHAAASIGGTGVDHVYNLFIPPGTDICSNGANTRCFSPDHPATFAFCAFHSAVLFSDIGIVVFTVEPETGVRGCASQQPSPNGIVADSVDSTLSHELFETITDPLLNAWFVRNDLDLRGAEIGDVCQPSGNAQAQFLVPTFFVNGHPYAIQLEYSNAGHGCFSRPVDGH